MTRPQLVVTAVVIACCLLAAALAGCSSADPATGPAGSSADSIRASDEALARAFADHAEDVPVEGQGVVTRLLADDTEGGRHQRFIVELISGQTLLIVHNIDIAPRIDSLEVGDTVAFKGEFVWNEQGGLVHWTHHDPDGMHPGGWIRHEGSVYD